MMTIVISNPIIYASLMGFLAAVAVDLHAWKSWDDAAFNWRLASFRWVVGAITAALAAAGLGKIG